MLIHMVSVIFIIKAISDGRCRTVALAIFHGLSIAKLYPFRGLAAFFLGNNSHDREAELRILIHGVEVDILDQHAHIISKQLPHRLHTVHDVPGKAGNLFCQDKVKSPRLCIPYHFQKLWALIGSGPCNALIYIARNILPLFAALDLAFKISDLMLQRV